MTETVWTQEFTRERVKVLEMMEELQRLRDLRAKREAKAASKVTVARRVSLQSNNEVQYATKGPEGLVRAKVYEGLGSERVNAREEIRQAEERLT